MSNEIVIVGCGVSGLSTGIRLIEAGYEVKIVADRLPHDTVSAVAAAVWFPYHVGPIDKALRWAEETRVELTRLGETDPSTGLYPIELRELYEEKTEVSPWWLSAVPSYKRIPTSQLPNGFADGLSTQVPMIETPIYIDWLLNRYAALGGTIELGEKLSSLTELDADVIVNCTGLGAHDLCADKKSYPIRGLIALMTNPGIRAMTTCTIDGKPTYIIPRLNEVVIGGTTDKDVWDESIDEALLTEIIARCTTLIPQLADAKLISYHSGLRPGRAEVRLEMEQVAGKKVIHNYGHGGSGYGLSWGCADEVVGLVRGSL